MSRIRSVHPGLFTDEAFVSLSPIARVLLVGVWTECDDQGAFEWKPVTLKMRILPVDNVDVGALLEELAACNAVKRYTHEGREYGAVRNFGKYQRPKKPKCIHFIPPELRTYINPKVASSPPETLEADPVPKKAEKSPQMEDGGGKRKDEGSKQAARAPEPEAWVKLATDIVRAFEGKSSMPPDTRRAEMWISQGYDPAIIIATIRTSLAKPRSRPINNLVYFDELIREAHERRAPAGVKAAVIDWDLAAQTFRDHGIWPDGLGPEPGYGGCRCPHEVLERHGLVKKPDAA
jgi:hypothetical protein